MKLLELQTHLAGLGLFSAVRAALSLDEIQKQNIRQPIAFVVPADSSAQPNQRDTGPALQHITETYSVIYCVPSINDRSGMKANSTLQTLIKQTRASLIGFSPEGAQPMQFVGGELMMLEGGFVLWHDQFTTQFFLEGNA